MRASERTGALRESLTRYIAYQQQIDALRNTLVNASIYPAVLLGAGFLVTMFLLGYVVPRFSSIYEELGSNLPLASRILLKWGQLIEMHTFAVVVAFACAIGAAAYALSRPATRAALGAWVASLPTIGEQLRVYQLARMYRTVGMLLRGGMPAVTALQMSSGLLGESLRPRFLQAIQAVREGQSLANALDANGLTTPVATRMLRVGERSGNMGEMTETDRRVLRRVLVALDRHIHAPDRAADDDRDRPVHRRHRHADVFSDLPARGQHPVNALAKDVAQPAGARRPRRPR